MGSGRLPDYSISFESNLLEPWMTVVGELVRWPEGAGSLDFLRLMVSRAGWESQAA